MPFLADLDAPPSSRGRGLLLGAAIAVPVCLGLGSLVLPRVRAAMLAAAADHDRNADSRGAYMQEVCGPGLRIERDERLCACVLGTEYPGLDCVDRFNQWLLVQQVAACELPGTFDQAPSFCSCVATVIEHNSALELKAQRREWASAYPRCAGLPDALDRPLLQGLASQFGPEDAAASKQ